MARSRGVRALRGIWTEDNFNFCGDFYRFTNYSLKPIDPQPEIFQGGSSRAAGDTASRVSDWYFTNGNSVEGIKAQVDDIRAKAKANKHQVKIGVNAFAIARDTEAEAQAVLKDIIDHANPKAVDAFAHEVANAGKASPEREANWAKSTFEDLVQYNDGFKTSLIFRDARAAIAMGPSNIIAREWIGKAQVGLPLELFYEGGE